MRCDIHGASNLIMVCHTRNYWSPKKLFELDKLYDGVESLHDELPAYFQRGKRISGHYRIPFRNVIYA